MTDLTYHTMDTHYFSHDRGSETQGNLKRVMNPVSHASLVLLYEAELRDAIAGCSN